MSDADPRCPECGEPIGKTATYCMHCSADLTEELSAADADGDWTWDGAEGDEEASAEGSDGTTAETTASPTGRSGEPERDEWGREPSPDAGDSTVDGSGDAASAGADDQLLDPDGLVDNSLTVVAGIIAGIVVGLVGTVVLAFVTGSGWALLFGIVAWLGATAYLVRRRTVQEAVSKGAYAVAVVLLAVPAIALSPVVDVDGGASGRGGLFFVLLVFVAVPAAIAAAVGWFASRYVPRNERGSEG